jgi:hypothetical protein
MTAQDQKQQELDLLTQKEIDSQWYKTQQVKQGNKKIVQAGTKITNTKVAAATTATERARHDRAVEANYTVGQNIARRRVAATENANVYHLIDAALGGSTSTSPVKIQRKQYLDPSNPLVVAAKAYSGVPSLLGKSAPKNIFHDKQGWYTFNTTTVTPQQFAIESGSSGTPVTKAQDLWDVISNAMPSEAKTPNGRKLILGVINSRLGISGWTPGKTSVAATNAVTTPTVGGAPSGPAAPATATYLAKLPLSSLTDVAMKLGFPGSPKAVSRQHLVDFILAHQGKYNAAAA